MPCLLSPFHQCVLGQVTLSLSIPLSPRHTFSELQGPPAHLALTATLTIPRGISHSPFCLLPAENTFSRRVESKAQNHFEETNSSSQNSSGECVCGVTWDITCGLYSSVTSHRRAGTYDWGLLVRGGACWEGGWVGQWKDIRAYEKQKGPLYPWVPFCGCILSFGPCPQRGELP